MKCLALVAVLLAAAPAFAGEKPVLQLGSEDPLQGDADEPMGSLLVRELARQAVLIAARDELGVPTRDQSLREEVLEGERFDLSVAMDPREGIVVKLRRRGRTLLTRELAFTAASFRYDKLVKQLEALSRGDLVAPIRSAGFPGEPRPRAKERSALAPGIAERLERLTVFDQFAAVRSLHALAAASGETPEILGGLVRGYANLGVLAERQWSVGHKVFKARALLYAERLVVADAASPTALAHRSYARALAGLHAHALSDLEKVPDEALPTWTPLVRAFVRGERPLLEEGPGTKEHPRLAKLLALLAVEDSRGDALQGRLGAALLAVEPGCHRARDILAAIGAVASRDRATRETFEEIEGSLTARVHDLPGAPADVEAAAKKGIGALVAALAKAGDVASDRTEPSWGVLARVFEDMAVLAAFRRAEFLKSYRSDDLAEFLPGVKSFVREHPYGAVVTSIARDGEKRRHALEDLSIVDASLEHGPIIAATVGFDPGSNVIGNAARDAARLHSDSIERDVRLLALMSSAIYGHSEKEKADIQLLRKVSPASPLALAIAMRRDVETHRASSVAAIAEATGHPDLLEALARNADAKRDEATAREWWEKRVEVSPDAGPLAALAESYEKGKRFEDFRQTVDRLIEADPDADPKGAMRLRIARRLIAKGKTALGLDYVERAAKCGERGTLVTATELFEEAKDFVRAERCVSDLAKGYQPYVTEWLYWCTRTGHGDAKAARELAEPEAERWSESEEPSALREATIFWLVADEPKRAAKTARDALAKTHRPFFGLHVAILSKGAKRRTDALDDVIAHRAEVPEGEKRLIPLVRLMKKAVDDADVVDADAIAKLVEGESEKDQALIRYFVARFLEARGKPDEARAQYEKALGPKDGSDLPLQALVRGGLERTRKADDEKK